MYFIKETDKPSKILKLFNIVKIEHDKIILPINDEKIEEKQSQKLAIKTKKILDMSNCNKIILSKKIKKQQIYVNFMNSYNVEIVDGRWLFEILVCKLVEYIKNKKNLKEQEISIGILVNSLTEYSLYNIKQLTKKYKKVSIITNHIEKLKKIENQIFDNEGLMITVVNNKRKSLAKTNIILNIDFPQELINQYNIYEEAVVVNIQGNIKIRKKRFNGICINNYEIKMTNTFTDLDYDYDKEKYFEQKDIYEASIYKKQPMENIIKKINRDKIEIKELIGENSIL